jgi:hypothetical protein
MTSYDGKIHSNLRHPTLGFWVKNWDGQINKLTDKKDKARCKILKFNISCILYRFNTLPLMFIKFWGLFNFGGRSILWVIQFWGSFIFWGHSILGFIQFWGPFNFVGHSILGVIQFWGSFNFGCHSIWGWKKFGSPFCGGLIFRDQIYFVVINF